MEEFAYEFPVRLPVTASDISFRRLNQPSNEPNLRFDNPLLTMIDSYWHGIYRCRNPQKLL
jgi:hypothetical protein